MAALALIAVAVFSQKSSVTCRRMVPIPFKILDGHVVIPATIGGKSGIHFEVDTGAGGDGMPDSLELNELACTAARDGEGPWCYF